jgi:outer membrane protein assembly factor BamA
VNVFRLCLISSVVLAANLTVFAQGRNKAPENPPASRLAAIKVTGTQRYTDAEIIAASGLQIGQTAADVDFKAATARLADTGLFTELAYSYSSSIEGTKLEFQLTDNDQLVPVHFDNIPWFSDEELIEKVKAHVPLFKGQLPVEGSMIDQVADVIEALVVQTNPRLHSTYLRSSPNPGDPIDSVVFSVSGAEIRIRNVEYTGASPPLLPSLAAAAAKLQGVEYHREALDKFAALDLKPIFWKLGYLKVTFGDPQARVLSGTPEETIVDVTIPIIEGQQYKLSGVSWVGNTIFPADKLQAQVRLPSGQIVDATQLEQDLDRIRASYGTRGYVRAVLTPRPEFDDTNASVAYAIEVQEGEQYRMGELDIDGVDDHTHARLVEAWRLAEGEIFNSSYPAEYLKNCRSILPDGGGWDIHVDESVNNSDKTVDVTLRFTARSPG